MFIVPQAAWAWWKNLFLAFLWYYYYYYDFKVIKLKSICKYELTLKSTKWTMTKTKIKLWNYNHMAVSNHTPQQDNYEIWQFFSGKYDTYLVWNNQWSMKIEQLFEIAFSKIKAFKMWWENVAIYNLSKNMYILWITLY